MNIEIKKDIVIIKLKNKEYKINKEKLYYVFKLLDDIKGIKEQYNSEKVILMKMKEYKLIDEVFLNSVDKLW